MNIRHEFHFFKSIAITVLLWVTGIAMVFSQNYLFDLEVINVEDGLPHRNTFDIVQDKKGFIWLGTLGSVNRYDGYNFKTYNSSFLNIFQSSAVFLAIDSNDYLWYCEGRAVTEQPVSGVINTRLDSIYSISAVSKGLLSDRDLVYISNSGQNPDDILMVTRSGSVYKYDGHFEEIYRFPDPVLRTVHCREASDGSYWIVYNSKVIQIKHGKPLRSIPLPDVIRRIDDIISLQPDLILKAPDITPGGQYWILEDDRFVPLSLRDYAIENFTDVIKLHKDYIVYGIKDTLIISDKEGNVRYSFDEFESLKPGRGLGIERTFTDRQNNLWATSGNGLLKITVKKNPFHISGPENSVRGIYRDGDYLWLGSPQNNIVKNMTDGSQKTFWEPYFGNVAVAFLKDDQEQLWIGTNGGVLLAYLPEKDSYVAYTLSPLQEYRIPFQNRRTKNYWIGASKGLYRFDRHKKTVSPYTLSPDFKNIFIRQLYQNAKGIWIVTDKGLFLMDAEKEQIVKHYTINDGLPTNNLNHLYEDAAGILWLGTKDAGLVRWDPDNKSFRQYTRNNGLSNNNIYAVYEDDYNTLWLPSDYGLMAFDKITATTKLYLPQNGIAHEEFNANSHFQDKDGTLYFGGLKGMTSFHPKDLQRGYAVTPPLYVNRVRVLEENSEDFTDKTPARSEGKTIRLHPTDKILELELTLLDYERSAENQYAYKIEGHQEQWVYTRENKIAVTNPPFGRYNLIIKARGASGSWSENMLTIPVHRPLPFYRQWWFILLLALVAIAIIITGSQWRIRKLQKDRSRLEAEVRKRTRTIEEDKITIERDKQLIETQAEALKALDKAKTRFFANITHEFRTPLTLVKGPIEQIIAAPPPPAALKKRLGSVLKNADNLLDLINQLLDISKLESKRMKIEVSHGDIVRYTGELVARFQPLADKKKLHLDFKTGITEWKTWFDADKWNKIVYNLLSNAMKYTPEGGSVRVDMQQSSEAIRLAVSDTGTGIEAAHLNHIFDRFYQADGSATRMHEGTGIGLALVKELVTLQNGRITVKSQPGKGSIFTITLPVIEGKAAGNALPLQGESLQPLPALPETATAEHPEPLSTNGEREKLQLLIVEDNAEMRAYIRSCIDTGVYHVLEASNGEEGIEKALETVPDLIISDVMMPKKNGFGLTEAIRAHIATSHIPLILLTARAALESRLKGLERGADAYLTKPFSPQELALRIRKLIELRQLLQQRYQNPQAPVQTQSAFEKEDHFVSEFKNYILENLHEPDLDVDSISRHFAMSRMQLYRKFKALINTPVAHYIRNIRLETAVRLLKEKQLNITEVAYATGFSSVSYFSAAFKRAYGKPPSKL